MKKDLSKNIRSKINKFFTKKNVMLVCLSSAIAAVPLAAGISQIAINTNGNYSFHNRSFSSLDSAVNYVKQNSKVSETSVEGLNSTWKVEMNGKVQSFSDPKALRDAVYNNYVKTTSIKTNVNLNDFENEKGILGITDASIINNIYKAEDATVYSAYQGINDTTYTNQNENANSAQDKAYKSYFDANIKNAYYFNNTYFKDKKELKDYLISHYIPNQSNSNKANTIVIQGPNGVKSNPINLSNTTAMAEITSFINNNATKTLSYTNSRNQKKITINNKNINTILDSTNIVDFDYIHMQSNQGESRYVVDNNIIDDHNLIGPYFYNGVLDTNAFTNKKMWKKVNDISAASVYVNSKVDTMIGSFFSSVINDDNVLNISQANQNGTDPLLFRTLMMVDDQSSYDDWFLKELGKLSPQLKNAVVQANVTLMQGKKYNTFHKVSILYSFLMQRIVSWNLGQEIMNLVVDYFTNVCNFIQDAIELVALDKSLLVSKDGKTTFDVKTFFQIGNSEYDLNTSTEYFLGEIKEQFPNLVAVMSTYMGAQNNILMASGLIPFKSLDNRFLIDYKVYDDSYEYYKIESKLNNIYEVFSGLKYDQILESYIKHSTLKEVQDLSTLGSIELKKEAFKKLTTTNTLTSMGEMLSGIGAKNSSYHELARSVLNSEIKIYLETLTVVTGGYLSKLASNKEGKDRLGSFINLVTQNPDLDSFQVYLAILIDIRSSTNVFNNNIINDKMSFIKALSRLTYLGLGSAYLVGNSMSNLYNSYKYSKSNGSISNKLGITTSEYVSGNMGGNSSSSTSGSISSGSTWWSDTSSTWSTNSQIWDYRDGSSLPSLSEHPLLVWNENLPEATFVSLSPTPSLNSAKTELKGAAISTGKVKEKHGWLHKAAVESGWFEYAQSKWVLPELLSPRLHGSYIPDDDLAIYYINAPEFFLAEVDMSNVPSPDRTSLLTNLSDDIKSGGVSRSTSITSNGSKIDDVSLLSPSVDASLHSASSFGSIDEFIREYSLGDITDGEWSPSFGGSNKPSPVPPIEGGNNSNKVKFKDKVKTWWSGSNKFDKFKKAASTVMNYAAEIFATAVTGLEIFFFIYDLLKTTEIQDFYVYTTADGTNFYWDGGLTTSKYMGLQIQQVTGIESMKLLSPVQITLPQLEEFYYFNKTRYYDPNELKRDQLIYMLNSGVVNSKKQFEIQYSLNETADSAVSIEKLIEKFIGDLKITKNENGSFNFDQLNKNSSYLSSSSYSYANGVVIPSGDNTSAAETIVNNIRATKIAIIPDLDNNGVATGSTTTSFIYPGQYWDASQNKIITPAQNANFSKFLVDNSANKLKDSSANNSVLTSSDYEITNIADAETASYNNLFATYKLSFNLNKKSVLKNELVKNFSEMSNNVTSTNIFSVKTNNGNVLYFANYGKALTFALGQAKFTKQTDSKLVKSYLFNGIYFANEAAIRDWVLQHQVK